MTAQEIELAAVLFGAFFVIALMFGYGRTIFRWLGFPVHRFRYRNPYDRKCVHCGYHEQMFLTIGGSHWETMDNGKAGHRCSRRDAK